MSSMKSIEADIEVIKARNKRVEQDKAWETSATRRIFIAISTYFIISITMVALDVDRPFLSAIIPAAAYLISTLTLGFIKSWWLRQQ